MKIFLQKYQATSHNINKLQQIILLYEGSIRLLKKAKKAAAENLIEEKFNYLDKLSQIINGLNASLDHTQGGEIASVLEYFYTSFYTKIFALINSKDLKKYDELEQELVIMLDGWKEVLKQTSSSSTINTQNSI
jgi:flagellar protein FliS